MTSIFDQRIDRSQTQSIRWDKYGAGVIPLWVADMDFAAPEGVLQALHRRIDHGVFGYTYASSELKNAIITHLQTQYDYPIDPDWLVMFPSVVSALHLAPRVLTQASDHVLIPSPAYHHFHQSLEKSGRDYSFYHFEERAGRWTISMAELESLVKPSTRLLMLCNPHNPGGTVFAHEELDQLSHFALKHDIIICSDEIHADLILDEGKKHIPIGKINSDIAQSSLSLMSLNKVFNFPGIGHAWMVIPNPKIREAMVQELHATIPEPNLLGYVATLAALKEGGLWYRDLIGYLRSNRNLVASQIQQLEGLKMLHLEATYLAWIDARGLGHENSFTYFLEKGVALSPGEQFAAPGFVRLNFGVPQDLLREALHRMSL